MIVLATLTLFDVFNNNVDIPGWLYVLLLCIYLIDWTID